MNIENRDDVTTVQRRTEDGRVVSVEDGRIRMHPSIGKNVIEIDNLPSKTAAP